MPIPMPRGSSVPSARSAWITFSSWVSDIFKPFFTSTPITTTDIVHTRESHRRFQNDKNCPLFLVSLKAGGLGLNLTAAQYVFLLDPWWNPAVEAQAIDRSHRIGQTQTVNAYRLIAPGTVEEKIWELQQSKAQTIADVLGEEGFARSLTATDLEYLFSED